MYNYKLLFLRANIMFIPIYYSGPPTLQALELPLQVPELKETPHQ